MSGDGRGLARQIFEFQGLEKQVAIKVLPHLPKSVSKMFLDEARLSLHLNHANIVQTFDVVKRISRISS